MSPALPGIHNTDFVLGGNPGVYADAWQLFIQLFFRQTIQLGAGQCQIPGRVDAQLLCDRGGRNFVIPGDHDSADTGLPGLRHRVYGFRSGWIDHGDQPQKDEIRLLVQGEPAGVRKET